MSENQNPVQASANPRQAEYPIDPIYLERWSPRSYQGDKPVTDADLFGVLEAARWAPSANNGQPWRFIVARTPEDRAVFHGFINPSNLVWCQHAPVLLLLLSKTTFEANGHPNRKHAFDAGTAWGYLALEAARKGLSSHAMGGFDAEKAREALGISDDYEPQVVISLGYRGAIEQLPEGLQLREVPSPRKPLAETVIEGHFPNR
ncbi:nitroreductase family protein [Gorillibacterium massiliense]|uniref:nitroreductase family protein n=1 Tax=Gorillibacterium massiliense TaxID=1280390 RepID=UPI0004B3DFCE|nr:nitroreductase family protein [Gorillibacterium massiliense]